jgi:predicted DsbA family dithiol-disulfide isomerase
MNAGVQGTPSFFINRHTMSGAQPYAVFEQAIEQFLDSAG